MEVPKAKLTNKAVIIIITCLVIVVAIFLCLNLREERLDEGQIRIRAGSDILGTVTLEDVKQLPAVKKKLAINSTLGITKHHFTCTPLSEVFNKVDPSIIDKYEKIITIGVDNYTSPIRMKEVLKTNNVYLVYEDNGEPLKSKTGVEGTMRVVILNDQFGQRFTNFLVEMQLE